MRRDFNDSELSSDDQSFSLPSEVSVPGYEHVGFTYVCIPPDELSYSTATADKVEPSKIPSLTDEKALECVLALHSNCWNQVVSQQPKINGIDGYHFYTYSLESFGEMREVRWNYEPSSDQKHVLTEKIRLPWQIQRIPSAMFEDASDTFEIPHSSFVVKCPVCKGDGWKICASCQSTSHVTSEDSDEILPHPLSPCYEECRKCLGSSRVLCSYCKAGGYIRFYIEMRISWSNHIEYQKFERNVLPEHIRKTLLYERIFEERKVRVSPLSSFPDSAVKLTSIQKIQKHKVMFPKEQIIMQRQIVEILPVFQVFYSLRHVRSMIFLYGKELQTYPKDLQTNFFCTCILL